MSFIEPERLWFAREDKLALRALAPKKRVAVEQPKADRGNFSALYDLITSIKQPWGTTDR